MICLLFLFPVHATLSYSQSILPSQQQTIISLDCLNTTGLLKPFSEINGGPLPIYYVKNGVDITKQYQTINIQFVRTHDLFGPTDISTIFPNWSADPFLEQNYDFTSSDPYITAIINAGCNVFYRLGESASDNETLRQPPHDPNKWAEICKHIAMHYNDGWCNGFHYNITYWEIWNEPDLSGFWNGTPEQYYLLYQTTATTLKSYNDSLKIGGPCISSINNENFTTQFLAYLIDNEVPLDFFSWHMYATTPYELYLASSQVRSLLDTYGLSECENINTEWNLNILTPQRDKDNAKNAAFTACTLTAFQDAYLDYGFRYRGTQDYNWLMRLIGFDLSLFTYNGLFKTPALSYLAMHHMVDETPQRLSTEVMNASNGITFLAGIADDKSNITLLVSNYESTQMHCSFVVNNISWSSSYQEVHYLIDDTHHFTIVSNKTLSGSMYSFTHLIKPSTVHFIRLTNTSYVPNEGPIPARIPLLLQLRFLDPFTKLLGLLIVLLIFS